MPSMLALSITAQDSIPAGTTFTVSVSYSLSENQTLRVYLDDLLLAEVFNHSSSIFVNESQLSSSVLAINATEARTVLSIAGQSESTKSIKVKVLNSGDVIDSKSMDITFFTAISTTEKEAMDALITALQVRVIDQNKVISDQNNTINTLKQDLNVKQNTINSLLVENATTTQALRTLSSEISVLQQSDSNKTQALQKISGDVNNLIVQREVDNAVTGLVAFGSSGGIVGIVLLAIIAIAVAVIMFIQKKRSEKFYQ
jgi:hypothetical protein